MTTPPNPVTEYITLQDDIEDAWLCICGNDSTSSGFTPCLEDGSEVEPTLEGPWDGELYVCLDCGRIIDQMSLEVVPAVKL